MNSKLILFSIIFQVLVFRSILVSVDYKQIPLEEVSQNINQYKNKSISLKLRLRNIDMIFDKIYFYDTNNHDITFDTSALKKKPLFNKLVLNLHEGLFYTVTFIVKDVGSLGELIGELESFDVFILEKIPDGK